MALANIFVVSEAYPDGELLQEYHPSNGHATDGLILKDTAEDLGIKLEDVVRAWVADNDGDGSENT